MYQPTLGALEPVSEKITAVGALLPGPKLVLEVSYKGKSTTAQSVPTTVSAASLSNQSPCQCPLSPSLFMVTPSVNYEKNGRGWKAKI